MGWKTESSIGKNITAYSVSSEWNTKVMRMKEMITN